MHRLRLLTNVEEDYVVAVKPIYDYPNSRALIKLIIIYLIKIISGFLI